MSELRLAWGDRDQTFQVHVGDMVHVSLWGNGTTGFFWSPAPVAGGALEYVDRESAAGTDAETGPLAVLGSGGERDLTFRAHKIGRHELSIRYSRGLEDPDDIVYQVTIDVRRDVPADGKQGQG